MSKTEYKKKHLKGLVNRKLGAESTIKDLKATHKVHLEEYKQVLTNAEKELEYLIYDEEAINKL